MTRRLFIFLGAISASVWVAVPAQAAPSDPTSFVFSVVQSSSLVVDWQGTTGTTIQYNVEISSPFGTISSSSTVALSSTFTALDVNTQYFARVQAMDTIDLSSSSWVNIDTYTWANAPISLTTTTVSFTSVDLVWDGNSNPAGTIFSVERSTDAVTFASVVSQPDIAAYSDTGISPGVNYEYRVLAFNQLNVPTAYSNSVLVMTPGAASLPRTVPGLSATRTQTGPGAFQIDFQWHAVTERTDSTVLTNLTGYEIYRSTSLLAPRSQWTLETTEAAENWSTTSDGTISYYSWRTIDSNGQRSDWSQVLDDGADGNHFFFASDFVSRMQLPASAAASLLRSQNNYGSDLDITLTEVASEETGRIVKSLHFKILNYDTGSEVTDLTFDPPVLRGTIGYTVQDGQVVVGSPSSFHLGAPVVSAAEAADQLSLYWFNGNVWVKTTGLVNTADSTVSFTGSRTGRYQIRAAAHVSGLILTRVYPRIISPNDDGWNDKVVFEFDNPQLLPLSGNIYDLSDALVADLVPSLTSPNSALVWDGKDSSGKAVPGGIYLYQIEQAGIPASGAVVVAR